MNREHGSPSALSEAEAIIREARARQRRRLRRVAVLCFVTVLALTTTLIGLSSSSSLRRPTKAANPSPPAVAAPLPRLTDFDLIQPGGGSPAFAGPAPESIAITNAGTGRVNSRPLPPASDTIYPWIVEGPSVVAVEGTRSQGANRPAIGTAYAFDPTGGTPVALGPASGAVAAAQVDAVWLTTDSATPEEQLRGATSSATCTVREVSLTGRALTPAFVLPCDRGVLEGATGGLLTDISTGGQITVQLWDPETQTVLRSVPGHTFPPIANANYAVSIESNSPSPCGPSQCSVSTTNLITGQTVAWKAPPGPDIWTPIAIVPGQSDRLAVIGFTPAVYQQVAAAKTEEMTSDSLIPLNVNFPATLKVTNLATGQTLSTRPVTIALGDPITWSPHGAYVFVTRDQDHVTAYPATSSTAPGHLIAINDATSVLITGS